MPPVTVVFVNEGGPNLAVRPKQRPVDGQGNVSLPSSEPSPQLEAQVPEMQPEAPMEFDETEAVPAPPRARSPRRKALARKGARPSPSTRRARVAQARRKASARRPS